MSMQCELETISSELLSTLLKNPKTAQSQWFELTDTEDYAPEKLEIGVFWDGLTFGLTGSATFKSTLPLAAITQGSSNFPSSEAGEPPLYFNNPEQVQILNQELTNFSIEQFQANLNVETMQALDLYPNKKFWTNPNNIKELITIFEELKEYYQKASENNLAILISIA